jgi:hypothetical protein
MMIITIFYLELGAYMPLSEKVPSANMSRSLPTATFMIAVEVERQAKVKRGNEK